MIQADSLTLCLETSSLVYVLWVAICWAHHKLEFCFKCSTSRSSNPGALSFVTRMEQCDAKAREIRLLSMQLTEVS